MIIKIYKYRALGNSFFFFYFKKKERKEGRKEGKNRKDVLYVAKVESKETSIVRRFSCRGYEQVPRQSV